MTLPILETIQRFRSILLLIGAPVSLTVLSCGPGMLCAQALDTEVVQVSGEHRVRVTVEGKPFTSLIYPDSLEKPVLFPLYAPDGQIITRGFPLAPRNQEPTDHPHHIGLWFTYENVNGFDFWNNSYAIPSDKKNRYGWIRVDSILEIKSGKTGTLAYSARWEDQQKNILLRETTSYRFISYEHMRIIDRTTVLTAVQDIRFADAKDGLLGLRVARELELPSAQPKQFTDDKGNRTTVEGNAMGGVTGNYLTSTGKEGDSAWGTRARWCLLYGKMQADSIGIVIIDHPSNPGFPTYWHARGYGLFAANPLGQQIFSNGKEQLNFALKKGSSATFRYRIILASGKERLSAGKIESLASAFAK
jgi:Methane oxygenase PmoA